MDMDQDTGQDVRGAGRRPAAGTDQDRPLRAQQAHTLV